MKTKREVVTSALRAIRVVPVFGTPSAEDFALAAGNYDDLHAELTDQGLCYWTNTNNDTEEIPASVSAAMEMMLSDSVATYYGKQSPNEQGEDGRVVSFRVAGMRRLKAHMAKKPSGEATEFSSY